MTGPPPQGAIELRVVKAKVFLGYRHLRTGELVKELPMFHVLPGQGLPVPTHELVFEDDPDTLVVIE